MKTILSLIALLTLIGLLPFALAESRSAAKAAKAPAVSSAPAKEGKVIPAPAESTASTTATIPASPKPAASAGSKAASSKTSAKGKPEASKQSSASTSAKAGTRSASSRSTGKPAAKADSIAALTATQEDKLLVLLNEGTVEDLSAIPGIASTRAASIVKARPFASVHEIVLVEGVGNATFERILAHGKSLTQRTASKPEASRKS